MVLTDYQKEICNWILDGKLKSFGNFCMELIEHPEELNNRSNYKDHFSEKVKPLLSLIDFLLANNLIIVTKTNDFSGFWSNGPFYTGNFHCEEWKYWKENTNNYWSYSFSFNINFKKYCQCRFLWLYKYKTEEQWNFIRNMILTCIAIMFAFLGFITPFYIDYKNSNDIQKVHIIEDNSKPKIIRDSTTYNDSIKDSSQIK